MFAGANLTGANLSRATLVEANFKGAQLVGTNLSGANLNAATLLHTNLANATLSGCRIYGVNVWNANLSETKQSNLIITPFNEPEITVDNLQVAQFIYLLLNNPEIRNVLDAVTSKAVLILGRFTNERRAVLEVLRDELRRKNYLPILFDFEKPSSRNLTETIKILAGLSRFIVADVTDARSIPQELQAIVPHMPSVPVQPLILRSQHEWAMFESFKPYPWVLNTFEYDDVTQLLTSLTEHIIAPAEAKAAELKPKPLADG
jgi:hypothetical protein